MIRLGVTGGIGSGKSYVCNLLKAHGVLVYEADREAKRLMTESPEIKRKLTELLGENAYLADGGLNKAVVADYLFGAAENASRINSIVHPEVRKDFCLWAQSAEGKAEIVALEAAILYESGFDSEVDRVLMVYAPMELRIRRTVARDFTEEESVRKRIGAQMDDVEKMKRADYVVINDGSKPLEPEIEEIINKVKSEK